jgi:hypothetical protein
MEKAIRFVAVVAMVTILGVVGSIAGCTYHTNRLFVAGGYCATYNGGAIWEKCK